MKILGKVTMENKAWGHMDDEKKGQGILII